MLMKLTLDVESFEMITRSSTEARAPLLEYPPMISNADELTGTAQKLELK